VLKWEYLELTWTPRLVPTSYIYRERGTWPLNLSQLTLVNCHRCHCLQGLSLPFARECWSLNQYENPENKRFKTQELVGNQEINKHLSLNEPKTHYERFIVIAAMAGKRTLKWVSCCYVKLNLTSGLCTLDVNWRQGLAYITLISIGATDTNVHWCRGIVKLTSFFVIDVRV